MLGLLASIFLLIGASCTKQLPTTDNQLPTNSGEPAANTRGEGNADAGSSPVTNATPPPMEALDPAVALPIADYASRRTLKAHGEYIRDRFSGYHLGDDIEYVDVEAAVPVQAIADGTVVRAARVSGYGGFVSIEHVLDGKTVIAVYGHLDFGSVSRKAGEVVTKGQTIGNLGQGGTAETDGERKHLHFALYEPTSSSDRRVNGYESAPAGLATWLNPTDFFNTYRQPVPTPSRTFDPATDRGGDIFKLRFAIPAGMEVEYVPSLEALNVFTVAGRGTARERSQVFIRSFDASSFLTLSTVTLHSTETLTVGQGSYDARRYDIEKKAGVADFVDQPGWRNGRHIVTDFHDATGLDRYYVVAAHPDLDPAAYQSVLDSMVIEE